MKSIRRIKERVQGHTANGTRNLDMNPSQERLEQLFLNKGRADDFAQKMASKSFWEGVVESGLTPLSSGLSHSAIHVVRFLSKMSYPVWPEKNKGRL